VGCKNYARGRGRRPVSGEKTHTDGARLAGIHCACTPEKMGDLNNHEAHVSLTTHHQILIIEDDAETREALQAFLAMHGYAAVGAGNGAEGLRKLRAGLRPCLILLDLTMPEKNGFQFRVEQIVDPLLADIPVVIYSGDAEAHAQGTVLGGIACLTKPLDVDKLMQVLKAYC
jgi:CheY-like chemotaxis protein